MYIAIKDNLAVLNDKFDQFLANIFRQRTFEIKTHKVSRRANSVFEHLNCTTAAVHVQLIIKQLRVKSEFFEMLTPCRVCLTDAKINALAVSAKPIQEILRRLAII